MATVLLMNSASASVFQLQIPVISVSVLILSNIFYGMSSQTFNNLFILFVACLATGTLFLLKLAEILRRFLVNEKKNTRERIRKRKKKRI